jgi:hypothetical protein
LHLAARQLVGPAAGSVREADAGEQLRGARVDGGARVPVEQEREADVLRRRQGRQEVEELEHEADVAPAEEGEVVVRHRRQPVLPDHDVAVVGDVESADQMQQCRLPGSARTDDGAELPPRHVERDAVERAQGRAALRIPLRHAGELDQAIGRGHHRLSEGRARRLRAW